MKNKPKCKERRTAANYRGTKTLTLCTGLVLCLILLAAILFRPAAAVRAVDLMEDIAPNAVTGKDADEAFVTAQTDFALRLFRACAAQTPEKNTLVSPLSVMLALAMTGNGAEGQTRAEMEAVLGMPIEDLNAYLYNYVNQLPTTEKNKVSIANSIWYRDDDFLHIEKNFLQANADYYGADAYQVPFNQQTVGDINDWTNTHTDGMIDKIVDRMDDDTVMYLINALVFDAQWSSPYTQSDQIYTGTFHAQNGAEQSVTMMRQTETGYLDDGLATGFVKDYAGGNYRFAALLPNEGVSLAEYLASLTPEGLQNTLNAVIPASVRAAMPQFSLDYDLELSDVLKDLGISAAFDGSTADFSAMGTSDRGNLRISNVLHKTHITVDTKGTRAAAVTKVEAADGAAMMEYSVTLNRPFVYLIIDTQTNLPLFIGTLLSIGG